jgi:hypothetical protein
MDNRITVRLNPELHLWLRRRASRQHGVSIDLQARTEIELWRTALGIELKRFPLTVAEASCLADVMNGHLMQPHITLGMGTVYANCSDAFRLARETPIGDESSYGAKWAVDETRLLARLRGLSPVADHALEDAFARWWDVQLPATADGFRAAGLRIVDPAALRPALRTEEGAGQ